MKHPPEIIRAGFFVEVVLSVSSGGLGGGGRMDVGGAVGMLLQEVGAEGVLLAGAFIHMRALRGREVVLGAAPVDAARPGADQQHRCQHLNADGL